MNAVLFLSLVFILGAAVPFPWWPNSAYGRSQHHRLRDKQPPAYETKIFDHETLQKAPKALDVRPTPEASQKAAVKLWDGNSETHLTQGDVDLIREFEEHWIARSYLNSLKGASGDSHNDGSGLNYAGAAFIPLGEDARTQFLAEVERLKRLGPRSSHQG